MFGFLKRCVPIGIGDHVVTSTSDIRLPGNCLHAGRVIGKTSEHFRIMYDEIERDGKKVDNWVYKYNVARIETQEGYTS